MAFTDADQFDDPGSGFPGALTGIMRMLLRARGQGNPAYGSPATPPFLEDDPENRRPDLARNATTEPAAAVAMQLPGIRPPQQDGLARFGISPEGDAARPVAAATPPAAAEAMAGRAGAGSSPTLLGGARNATDFPTIRPTALTPFRSSAAPTLEGAPDIRPLATGAAQPPMQEPSQSVPNPLLREEPKMPQIAQHGALLNMLATAAGRYLGEDWSNTGRQERATNKYNRQEDQFLAREDAQRGRIREMQQNAAADVKAAETAPSIEQQIANAAARGDQETVDRLSQDRPGSRARIAYHYTSEDGKVHSVYEDGTEKIQTAPAAKEGRGFTNPFEAFVSGDPDEKQAAQDFIAMEARTHRQNEKPGEVEQRYSLYQKDPEAYRQMYGDRGGAQDQAQAARMMKHFDSARKEIEGNFLLDDATKKDRLAEIDALEKPYLDAAAVRPKQGAAAEDTVTVISPRGVKGTIPRANLQRALKRGYKQAQ
jgi:hypothetical protein